MAKKGFREIQTRFERDGLTPCVISQFQHYIRRFYHEHYRQFPWRETSDPYHILVSEIMLQQTQTSRVVSKYNEFISTFPNIFALAEAPLRDVLRVWQGLGYNRRALALHRTAREIVAHFDGQVPPDPEVLQKFPGIGQYTAAAIAAIAFNKPTEFLETNIRTVFSFFFLRKSERITDRDIIPLVEATLDREHPREWYYALFDYGSMLKNERKSVPNTIVHRQSKFRGSNRELRGMIIRHLLSAESIREEKLISLLNRPASDVRRNLKDLRDEGFLDIAGGIVRLR